MLLLTILHWSRLPLYIATIIRGYQGMEGIYHAIN